jgi:hypothetical protein
VAVREIQSDLLVLARFPRSAYPITSEAELMSSSSSSELLAQNSSSMLLRLGKMARFPSTFLTSQSNQGARDEGSIELMKGQGVYGFPQTSPAR